MFRFSEWLEMESFVESVDLEACLDRCLLESVRSVLRVAALALSPRLISESDCPEEFEEMSRSEALKKIHDSLKTIRQYGVMKRKRLVEAMAEIKDWMARMENDEDIDDLDLSGLSDILPPKEMEGKDTLQIAVMILSKLGYCTPKACEEILSGLELPEHNEKGKAAHEQLAKKVSAAAAETGNNVRVDGDIDFASAYEQLRCSVLKAYGERIEGKTRRNMLRRGYRDFERDDLVNDLFELILDMASRRKWSSGANGQPLPWGSGTRFEDIFRGWLGFKVNDKVSDGQLVVSEVDPTGPAAEAGMKPKDVLLSINGSPLATTDDLKEALNKIDIGQKVAIRIMRDGRTEDIEAVAAENLSHMDNYIGLSLAHKSKSIGQKAGRVNNPLSGEDVKEEIHNNKPRKVKLIRSDLKAHEEWKERSNSPDPKVAAKAGADPLKFYADYIKDHPEYKKELVSGTGNDRLRSEIMRDIQLELTFSSKARLLGLSWDPSLIEKTLRSYSSSYLRKSQRKSTFASELVPKDSDGSSDEVMTSLVRSQQTDDELVGDVPNPMDKATPHTSDSSEAGLLSRFFRPYLIRSVKQIASRGERSAGRALFLCLKFGIACSFTSNQKGEPVSLSVNERESFDPSLDEKVSSYMFDRFSGNEGSHSLFSNDSGWDQWSHEKKTDSRVMDNKSFCNVFFDSITEKANTQTRILQIYSELPESSRRIPDGAGGSVEAKHYEYNPAMFPASWTPSGKTNSLKASSNQALSVILKGDKDLRGVLSELCDSIFDDMIKKDNRSLKSVILAKRQAGPQAAANMNLDRKARDAKYSAALARRPMPKTPPRTPYVPYASPLKADDEDSPKNP